MHVRTQKINCLVRFTFDGRHIFSYSTRTFGHKPSRLGPCIFKVTTCAPMIEQYYFFRSVNSIIPHRTSHNLTALLTLTRSFNFHTRIHTYMRATNECFRCMEDQKRDDSPSAVLRNRESAPVFMSPILSQLQSQTSEPDKRLIV